MTTRIRGVTVDIREVKDEPIRLEGEGMIVCVGGPAGLHVVFKATPAQAALMGMEIMAGITAQYGEDVISAIIEALAVRILSAKDPSDLLGDAKLFGGDTFAEMIEQSQGELP